MRLGAEVRATRGRRTITQARLGARVGPSQATISRAERGLGGGLTLDAWQRIAIALGGGLTLDAWQRIAIALGTSLRVSLPRDPLAETPDAGHLAMQELVLRLGRVAGNKGLVELPTKPNEPWRSIDVALIDDVHRRLTVVECWNTIGDIGAAARTSTRKLAEAEAIATARWGERTHKVGLVWVVRATKRNRALVARYPEVFASRFAGSSARWVQALEAGQAPAGGPRARVEHRRCDPDLRLAARAVQVAGANSSSR